MPIRGYLKRIQTDNQGFEVLAIHSMSCISGYAAHLMWRHGSQNIGSQKAEFINKL